MCNRCPSVPVSDSPLAERFLGWLNASATVLMISVGHRTGLFDTLAKTGPATSHELARASGLSERYIREWYGAMITSGILSYDADTRRATLPAEHAAFLTRAAAPNNLAQTAQWIAVLGAVECDVVEAFKHGKGIPYSTFGQRFHDVMAEESNQTTIGGLHEHIIPHVPGLEEQLRHGIRVLDVGCGKGLAMVHLAQRFPASRFTGIDLCPEAIADGRALAQQLGLTNVDLGAGDVARYGEADSFDLVTAFDAIHDQARPADVLANIRRVLRPGGTFLMQDIKARTAVQDNMDLPLGPFTYTISCMHCMSVSLAGGGAGLGAAWGRELALDMLKAAGFGEISVSELAHDIINYYYVSRKPAQRNRNAA